MTSVQPEIEDPLSSKYSQAQPVLQNMPTVPQYLQSATITLLIQPFIWACCCLHLSNEFAFHTQGHVSPVPDVLTVGVISQNLRVYPLFGWQIPWLWLLGDITGIMVSALRACRCFPGRCGHTSTWLIRFSTDVHGSSDSARSNFLISSFSTL